MSEPESKAIHSTGVDISKPEMPACGDAGRESGDERRRQDSLRRSLQKASRMSLLKVSLEALKEIRIIVLSIQASRSVEIRTGGDCAGAFTLSLSCWSLRLASSLLLSERTPDPEAARRLRHAAHVKTKTHSGC